MITGDDLIYDATFQDITGNNVFEGVDLETIEQTDPNWVFTYGQPPVPIAGSNPNTRRDYNENFYIERLTDITIDGVTINQHTLDKTDNPDEFRRWLERNED